MHAPEALESGFESVTAYLGWDHHRLDEALLFPVFEARSGIVNGPTTVMRDEHRQVRTALGLMRGGVQGSDARSYGDGLRFFESVLPDHNAKEEHMLARRRREWER